MVGWYYRVKIDKEPKFVEIWLKYFPEHKDKAFSINACYGINLNREVLTISRWEIRYFEDCKEIELSELEHYLKVFTNKENIYELW